MLLRWPLSIWSVIENNLSEADRCVLMQAMTKPSRALPAASWLAGLLTFKAHRPAVYVAEISVSKTHAHELEAASTSGRQALMSLSSCSCHLSAMQVGLPAVDDAQTAS